MSFISPPRLDTGLEATPTDQVPRDAQF